MATVKSSKNRRCPRCGKRCIYHRRKTNDNVCIFCGAIFKEGDIKCQKTSQSLLAA